MRSKSPLFARAALPAFCVLACLCAAALFAGPAWISPAEAFRSGAAGHFIFWEIRMPRVIGAALLGGLLAVAGLASQSALRNPLASPDVLGVSTGAALGACVGLLLGAPMLVVSALAFGAGIAVTALVAGLSVQVSARTTRDPILVALLVGMAISSFCAAGLSAVKWLADPASKLPAITFWLLGSLAAFGWREVAALAMVAVIAAVAIWGLREKIGVLELGDEVATSVGAPVEKLRWAALLLSALVAAVSVAVAGLIPWIALIIPHAARMLSGGSRPWALAAVLGAGTLVAVDTLCRSVSETELPPGIMLALIGVPGFLWLISRVARR